jgi:hypothetical protein
MLYLSDQRITSKLQHKAMVKLMDLTFFIQYKKVIDAPSRCKLDNSVWVINECIQGWVEILIQWYQDDKLTKQLLTRLSLTTTNSQTYTLLQAYEAAGGKGPRQNLREDEGCLQSLL